MQALRHIQPEPIGGARSVPPALCTEESPIGDGVLKNAKNEAGVLSVILIVV